MGSGTFTSRCMATYSSSLGRTYDATTHRVSGQTFEAKRLDEQLDPSKFTIRECCDSEEHPNTVPVILCLDLTGSMDKACSETAAALGKIVISLYDKYKDIEFCVMGVGDLDYDDCPIQMSQFESDVRIAVSLDKLYIELGGGGNDFESYTAAWYMGLYRTKLDCFDKHGRKGVIITMGDEPLNPYLPARKLNNFINANEEKDIETIELYNQAIEKFDIYHISVDSPHCCYRRYKKEVDKSFGELLGPRYKISTIDGLADTIEECISESIGGAVVNKVEKEEGKELINEKGELYW